MSWEHVERMRVEFPPPTREHLTVDAMDPVAANLHLINEYIGRGFEPTNQ